MADDQEFRVFIQGSELIRIDVSKLERLVKRHAAALELLREMRRPNPHSCACQRQWAARIDAILEER